MSDPLIVAEVSCNHAGDEKLAHRLVDAAWDAGANAVKFQLYSPDDMVLRDDLPHLRLTSGAWAGRHLWDLYDEAQTPREWFPELFAHARDKALVPFASVFSLDGVDYLETLDCPIYKIASAEAAWIELVEYCAETGKRLIVSDGVATEDEMAATIHAAAARGCTLVPLHCVADYPALPERYGFGGFINFPLPWGVSDHARDSVVAVSAVAMGASVVEAHLMLEPEAYSQPPLDSGHSYTPDQFGDMVAQVRLAAALRRHATPRHETSAEFARRWVWAADLEAGDTIGPNDVLAIRSGDGLSVGWNVVGRVLVRAVTRGDPVAAEDVQ